MRKAAVILLALATAGCSLPGLLRDIVSFQWLRPKPRPAYCVMTLEFGNSTGIAAGPQARDNAVQMACAPSARDGSLLKAKEQPSTAPAVSPQRPDESSRAGR